MNLDEIFKRSFIDEKMQLRFYYELLVNHLYILGESNCDGPLIEEGSDLKLVSIRSGEDSFVPVFLSYESMKLFLDGNEQEFIKAKGNDLLETLKASNIVINPGQEESIILYSDEIQTILSQGKN